MALRIGYDKGSPEETIVEKWRTECYHVPSDDLAQPVDKKAAGEFNKLVSRLLERVANREKRRLARRIILQAIREVDSRADRSKNR